MTSRDGIKSWEGFINTSKTIRARLIVQNGSMAQENHIITAEKCVICHPHTTLGKYTEVCVEVWSFFVCMYFSEIKSKRISG